MGLTEHFYSILHPHQHEDHHEDHHDEHNVHFLSQPIVTLKDLEHHDHESPFIEKQSSFFASYVNLTNTIIGAGMLGLPYAFAKSGWIIGSILMLIGAATTIFSLNLLTVCARKTGNPSSFFSITNATVPHLTFLIDVAVFLQCFGVGISYLIVIGGLMPDVMQQSGAPDSAQSRLLWVVIGFCVVAPLSCFNDLSHLEFTSTLSIVFVGVLAVLIFLYGISDATHLNPCEGYDPNESCKGETALFSLSLDTVRVFSIFIFAFSCQQNIFPVVNELERPSQSRFNNVIFSSIGSATVIYAIVSCSGYATYGSLVESNILLNYPQNALTSVTRVFISLLVAFSYPLQCLPARTSMMALWHRLDKDKIIDASVSRFRYIACTAIYLGCSFGIAMILTDLGVILSLVGATGATIVSYILPGIAYYEMHKSDPMSMKKAGALALFYFGLIIMPICVIFIFV